MREEMRIHKTLVVLGRGLALAALVTGLLGGTLVAFAAQAANAPLPAAAANRDDRDKGHEHAVSVTGVWRVTITSGKFAGHSGTAVLDQDGSEVRAVLTDGRHSASGSGDVSKEGSLRLSGAYKLLAHTVFATTIYRASATGQLSADGKTITGSWADSLGDKGGFTATRVSK